jgi:hypothetical protein
MSPAWLNPASRTSAAFFKRALSVPKSGFAAAATTLRVTLFSEDAGPGILSAFGQLAYIQTAEQTFSIHVPAGGSGRQRARRGWPAVMGRRDRQT